MAKSTPLEQIVATDPVVPTPAPEPPVPIPWPPNVGSTVWWMAVINTVVSEFAALMALLHPGFHVDPVVQAGVPMVAQIAATAVWIWAIHAHKTLALQRFYFAAVSRGLT